jgi:7,8-dihydropterin-6-yl-methyl-4-(beta-D-ribofuranosyl)aminobenzene 5'-phosphate synthase
LAGTAKIVADNLREMDREMVSCSPSWRNSGIKDREMKKILLSFLGIVLVLLVGAGVLAAVRYTRAVVQIEREWEIGVGEAAELGSTDKLEIIPLYEKAGDAQRFQIGHGVAYLVRTDNMTILVDVGNNPEKLEKSPMILNMEALGIAWDEIDAIVISHPHPDHLGGNDALMNRTISLGSDPQGMEDMPVLVPTRLTYPGAKVVQIGYPMVIAEGVALNGGISYLESFPFSLIQPKGIEQSLVVNVTGKGLVLITGCGHPTLEKMVERAETVFKMPVVGVVGGLHYTGAQAAELQDEIEFLKIREPVLVALSPHDSGAGAIQAFRSAFPEVYRGVEVGEVIYLAD